MKAIDSGSFVEEIVPIVVPQQDGSSVIFAEDEHPRRNGTLQGLADLKVLHPELDGFAITASRTVDVPVDRLY